MIFRIAEEADVQALGRLLAEGLHDAPSSEYEPDELPPDPTSAGEHLLDRLHVPGSQVLLAVERGAPVGLVRVLRREFLRSRHVADMTILVHPTARLRKIGSDLLGFAEGEAVLGGATKLAMRVAQDDEALRALLSARGWALERVEHGVLRRGGRVIDVGVWARHLEGASPVS